MAAQVGSESPRDDCGDGQNPGKTGNCLATGHVAEESSTRVYQDEKGRDRGRAFRVGPVREEEQWREKNSAAGPENGSVQWTYQDNSSASSFSIKLLSIPQPDHPLNHQAKKPSQNNPTIPTATQPHS